MGIDPGITTGLALIDGDTGALIETEESMSLKALASAISDWNPNVIAIEDFVGSGPRNKYNIATMKLIGFVHGFCFGRGIEVVEQHPQFRRHKLMVAGRLSKSGSRHERDALAHALAYLDSHPTGKK
jgi:predicted RNase H-like nuclease (RuvC/YqgF family)